jgi:hypothetical protein
VTRHQLSQQAVGSAGSPVENAFREAVHALVDGMATAGQADTGARPVRITSGVFSLYRGY